MGRRYMSQRRSARELDFTNANSVRYSPFPREFKWQMSCTHDESRDLMKYFKVLLCLSPWYCRRRDHEFFPDSSGFLIPESKSIWPWTSPECKVEATRAEWLWKDQPMGKVTKLEKATKNRDVCMPRGEALLKPCDIRGRLGGSVG